MNELSALLAHYGVMLVFVNVLLTQLGLPLPAIPVMMLAGGLAAGGHMSVLQAFSAAMVACLIADEIWYFAGRRYGHRVLAMLCRLSLSPQSCVRQTERVFMRWGVGSLVIAKFVPGLATVAPPLAGAIGLKLATFTLFDGIGAALWVGGSLLAGWLLGGQIDAFLDWLSDLGGYAAGAFVLLLVAYMAFKWFERMRFLSQLRAARVAVHEVYAMMERGEDPLVLDVRAVGALGADRRRIPKAVVIDPDAPDASLANLPRDREIIVYCS